MLLPVSNHPDQGTLVDSLGVLGDDPAQQKRESAQARDADRYPGESIDFGVFDSEWEEDDHAVVLAGESGR
jgi:hypothetical protein